MVTKYSLAIFLFALTLEASDESPFRDFVVGIWPEYDHPGILVIYSASIKDAYIPLHFEALVPDEIDFAMAIGQDDTSNNLQPVPVVERNNRKWISTTLVKDRFQLEFYFNPFGSTELREGAITIQLNQPLDAYHIAIQQPLAAEQYEFSEPDAETFRDEHGLNYSRIHSSSLPAGQEKTISFTYFNRSNKLSIVLLQEMLGSLPGSTKQEKSEARGEIIRYRLPTYQPLAVLAVVTMVIGVIFWKSNYQKRQTDSHQNGESFCPKCGSEVDQEDRFCSNCGRQLR